MKNIILMRHGIAEIYADALCSNAEDGICLTARKLLGDGLVPDVILHSPRTRAKETAQIIQREYQKRQNAPLIPLEEHAALYQEDSDCAGVLQSIGQQHATVLIVSHEPVIKAALRSMANPTNSFASEQAARDAAPDIDFDTIVQDYARTAKDILPAAAFLLTSPAALWSEINYVRHFNGNSPANNCFLQKRF